MGCRHHPNCATCALSALSNDIEVAAQLARVLDAEEVVIPLLPVLADFDGYSAAMAECGQCLEDRVRIAWLKSYLNR